MNINKLLIKSGLSYFYYTFTIFLITLILLGRSKSEQYFGFLPFFSYINFILGYIPLVLGDLCSQVIIFFYTLYTFLSKILTNFLSKVFSNNLCNNNLPNNSTSLNISSKSNSSKSTNLFYLSISNTDLHKNAFISKTLSRLRKDLTSLNRSSYLGTVPSLSYNNLYMLYNSTIKLNNSGNYLVRSKYISDSESLYNMSDVELNYNIRNTAISLNSINQFGRLNKYGYLFNFNIKSNLNLSNQKRWLTKNSLLTESLINNSFLITQAKKLISTGSLNKDFTDKTL